MSLKPTPVFLSYLCNVVHIQASPPPLDAPSLHFLIAVPHTSQGSTQHDPSSLSRSSAFITCTQWKSSAHRQFSGFSSLWVGLSAFAEGGHFRGTLSATVLAAETPKRPWSLLQSLWPKPNPKMRCLVQQFASGKFSLGCPSRFQKEGRFPRAALAGSGRFRAALSHVCSSHVCSSTAYGTPQGAAALPCHRLVMQAEEELLQRTSSLITQVWLQSGRWGFLSILTEFCSWDLVVAAPRGSGVCPAQQWVPTGNTDRPTSLPQSTMK